MRVVDEGFDVVDLKIGTGEYMREQALVKLFFALQHARRALLDYFSNFTIRTCHSTSARVRR